jgi:DnaJ-domain-containing protein 1
MTDYFALLGETRRPWLDLDALKSRYHTLSSESHPDRSHNAAEAEKKIVNDRYVELNAAYHTLRETKDRLLHLLILELGTKPPEVQNVPAGTLELFVEVGQACRKVDAFLAEKAAVTSPLLQVALFEKGMAWVDTLNALQQRIHAMRDQIAAELQALNVPWQQAPPVGDAHRAQALPLARLEEIYRITSYIVRWTGHIQERFVQLSF